MFMHEILALISRPHAVPNIDETIGRRLGEYRAKAGASDQSIADLLKVSVLELARIENGKKRAGANCLFILAKRFRVPVEVFFEHIGTSL